MTDIILISLIFSIFLVLGESTFSVYMPPCASDQLKDPLEYTLGNFGHIPYGRTLIGEVVFPTSQLFCDSDDLEVFNKTKNDDIKRFLVIKRGECKFTKKIINAQKRGFDLAIIYDSVDSMSPNLIMSNDGYGHLIDIPSIFISGRDGRRLNEIFKKCEQQMILKMQFDVKTSSIVNLTLWLDANNRETYITIKDFYRNYFGVINSHINVTLRFKIQENCFKGNCQASDCAVDGKKYCLQTDRQVQGIKIPGIKLIDEHLRSYYLYEELKKSHSEANWWVYMTTFDNALCLEQLDIFECSKEIMKNYYQYQQVMRQVQASKQNAKKDLPNALKMFAEDAYESDILFYPQATINGRNYYGLFRAPDIFNMICQSLQKPPKQCHIFWKNSAGSQTFNDQTKSIWKITIMIISMMLLTFIIALAVYTRIIKREINQHMSAQVNKMVEHYVSMTQDKSHSNAGL